MKTWLIYIGSRELAHEHGDPLLGMVNAGTKSEAEQSAVRAGMGNGYCGCCWAVPVEHAVRVGRVQADSAAGGIQHALKMMRADSVQPEAILVPRDVFEALPEASRQTGFFDGVRRPGLQLPQGYEEEGAEVTERPMTRQDVAELHSALVALGLPASVEILPAPLAKVRVVFSGWTVAWVSSDTWAVLVGSRPWSRDNAGPDAAAGLIVAGLKFDRELLASILRDAT